MQLHNLTGILLHFLLLSFVWLARLTLNIEDRARYMHAMLHTINIDIFIEVHGDFYNDLHHNLFFMQL